MLNPEQSKAVKHGSGPLLIVAGAGTGKTTVIIRRIAHLIETKRAKPEEILALTFTDKAAEEMEIRVDQLVPYGYVDVTIATFHSFGDRILRDHAIDLGMRSDYRVLAVPEQMVLIREHLHEFSLKHYHSLSDPTRHLQALLGVISRAQDEGVTPEQYLKWAKRTVDLPDRQAGSEQLEVARVYAKYQELKARKGFVDFADQVGLVLKLFKEKPAVLRHFQKRFKYILVDEFQDTNHIQFQLMKLLAGERANLTVVGDDDQAIYAWRGAAINNILNFEKTFPKTKRVVLNRNYRSSQIILDTAHQLIKFNNPDRLEVKAGINKRLKAEAGLEEKKVIHNHFDRTESQADWVAQTIKEKFEAGKKYADFAILVRSNNDAEVFEQALRLAGIPYLFSGAGGLYFAPEVQMSISFLKMIGDPADSKALFHVAVSSIYQLDPLDLQKMNTFAKRRNLTLHYVFDHLESAEPGFEVLADIKPSSKLIVRRIMDDINYYLGEAKEKSTGEILYLFLKRSGYLRLLTGSESLESEQKIRNLAGFFNRVKEFKAVAEVDRVSEFVKNLEILRQSGENPESSVVDQDVDAVHILTVHKAKGLEFKVVFMVSLVAEKFPVRQRRDPIALPEKLVKGVKGAGDSNLQEERRLFYVGMTRAKEELFLTSAADFGGKRMRKVSQFVLEALGLPKVDIPLQKRPHKDQIELFAPTELIFPSPKKLGADWLLPLSFSQIGAYQSCPLKYKYTYFVNVPTLPTHHQNYGQAMHNAVKEYGLAKLQGRKITVNDLIKTLKNNWSAEGYISRQHEDQRLAVAQTALKKFFARQEASQRQIKFVEEEFVLPKDNILIRGRWDRVDLEGGKAVMIDFKTSEVADQEKADKKAKENMQLAIYALVWAEKFGELPKSTELYFLDSGLIGSAVKGAKEVAKAWAEVQAVAEGIREANFTPTPDVRTCQYCDYAEICPSSAV